ncbi:hypothetical protein [Mucilaginibacter sp.]|uniref:plasmid mobilization protein n=1 Tax=Mucilaginibacter sp. TaxID=1882438 RepID=UPI0035BC90D8
MARPLKSDENRRTFTIPPIRVNASEKSLIEQNAKLAGQEVSVFLRSLGAGTKPSRTVPTLDRELLLKVLAEAGKQGSNLNQIARALNRKQDADDLNGIDGKLVNYVMREQQALQAIMMELLII